MVSLLVMQKLLVAVAVMAYLFVVPFTVSAATLVPCGGPGEDPCQTCHVVSLVNNVVAWLVMILGTIAAILIIVAGVRLVTSGGNTSAIEQAKSSMTNLIIGYLIVLSAWLVLDYGLKALLVQDGANSFGVWNTISCTAQPIANRVDVTQQKVVYIPIGAGLSNIPGWTYVSRGGSGGGGGDMGQAGNAGVWTAPCSTVAAGPTGQTAYSCVTQQAQCTAEGGIVTLNAARNVVTCNPRAVVGGANPPNLSAGGACSAALIYPYFGAQTGNAQCIIRGESTCGAGMVSRTDRMSYDNRAFSFGPMQINLTVHELIGCAGQPPVLDCKTAFRGRNYSARVINDALYQQCARAAQNIDCGLKNGARIQRRDGWYPTWSTAAGCGLR